MEIGGSRAHRYFSHGGSNAGYESLFVAYEQGGGGAVVMTNAQGGTRLASEVMGSIASTYGWPDFRPVTRTQIRLRPAALERYVGTYQLAPNFNIRFMLRGDQMLAQATDQPPVPTYPESEVKFFLKVIPAEVEFFSDEKGHVTHMVLHQNGQDMTGVKK